MAVRSIRPATSPAPDTDSARSTGNTSLRVLFDVGHPAQVHLFRNAIRELGDRGHETFVTSREKEVTNDLLEAYGIDHVSLSRRGDSTLSLVWETLTREVRLLSFARRFGPDVLVSRLGPVPAHVSALLGCRHVVVSDTYVDRPLIRRIHQGVTLPFVDTICVPESFELPIADEKRRPLDFQELAYLHPAYFEPDRDVLAANDIDPGDPYFVVRVSGWDAYHDAGHAGLGPATVRRLIERLKEHGAVYISAEGDLPSDLERHRLTIPPADIHHVLYYADLYVGDSGTMSTEAAILGTPAIRTNTMVGEDDEHVFRALEDRYDLLRSYADADRALEAVEEILSFGIDCIDWQQRRERLLAEQPDVTDRIVKTILESASDPRESRP